MARHDDPIAQMIAIRKEERASRQEQRKVQADQANYNLKAAQFSHTLSHDAATAALAQRQGDVNMIAKFANMAKDQYNLNRAARKDADVGHFYTMLNEVNPDDPDAATKIGKLKAAFPQAMQDEGVRATLANDWSHVLSQRGVSRADKDAADKRSFLMNYAAATAKDDEFGKNNPELKAIHDMYAKDLLTYEAKKRVSSGLAQPIEAAAAVATPAPVTVDSFFTGTPRAKAAAPAGAPAAAPTEVPELAAPPSAPEATPVPASTPTGTPVYQNPLSMNAPPASTPKEEQVADWAAANPGANVASNELNDMLNQSPETQILAPAPTPPPTPTPPPVKKEDEAAV